MSRSSFMKYDLVFGLGSACSCSETLRAAELQLASFPLDWVSGSDLSARTELLIGGFDGFMDCRDFERVENPGAFGHDSYRNRRTGLVHPHDFPQGQSLESAFAEVKSKYERRVSRLLSLLEKVRRVLVVWIGDPRDVTRVLDDDIRGCLDRLRLRWPSVSFEMRVLECVSGVCATMPEVRRGEGFVYLGFDYRSLDPNAKPWEVVPGLLVPCFSDCRVTEYRTDAERKAHRLRLHKRELSRFGATSALDLLLVKLQYRLCRHLKKSLSRRGVALDGKDVR